MWLVGPLPRLDVYSCYVDVVIRSLYLTRFARLVRRASHPQVSISNDPSVCLVSTYLTKELCLVTGVAREIMKSWKELVYPPSYSASRRDMPTS